MNFTIQPYHAGRGWFFCVYKIYLLALYHCLLFVQCKHKLFALLHSQDVSTVQGSVRHSETETFGQMDIT